MLKKALDGENKTSSDIDELNRKYVVCLCDFLVLSIFCHQILRKHFKCRCLKCCSNVLRYVEAKDLAKNLEKQAAKLHAEAEEAGNKALKIYANLTSLPPIDTKTLEVLVS